MPSLLIKVGEGGGGQYYVFAPNLEKAEFLGHKKKFSINLRGKRVVLKQKDNSLLTSLKSLPSLTHPILKLVLFDPHPTTQHTFKSTSMFP